LRGSTQLVPISGFDPGVDSWRFLLLPIAVGVVALRSPGASSDDLPRGDRPDHAPARSRELSEPVVLFRHVLRNAMIDLTQSVVVIPLLFMGSLITESFFSIPGLGGC
jgi:peptide/nickel transport system permease protein